MQLIGPEIIENLESNTPESLKLCYSKLMTSAQDDITKCIETIRDDAKHQEGKGADGEDIESSPRNAGFYLERLACADDNEPQIKRSGDYAPKVV